MTNILFAINILLSICLPLWLYFWISKTVKKHSLSCLQSKANVPDIQYLLKRWWAERCIIRKRRKAINCKNNDFKHSKIKDHDTADTILFYGTDQNGNSLFVKFCQKAFRVAEVSMQVTTSNGGLYVLPDYPETTFVSALNQEWTAAGLKIEFLEYQQRWRIVYNGMLRNLAVGGECCDENIQHIRLNFIFIANSEPLRWPEDWSSKLHSEALACELWKNPEWINKINLLDYTGFDHWGSILGQITYQDGFISTLYLRGLHQHRYGKHESHEFNESVTLLGVMPYGAMYYLCMSSTKHSFPQIQFGQFKDNSEKICDISKIGIELSDIVEERLNTDTGYKTWFTAENITYDILVNPINSITLHHGQPWNWQNKIITVKVEMDGKSGAGLMQLWSSYDGPRRLQSPMQLQFSKKMSACVQKDDYVVHFDDGKCQNENIVGGKGYSLAMLTSIKDAAFDVPKGFCVTVFAFELQLHAHKELYRIINDIEDVSVGKKAGDLQEYCDAAINIIESTPIPDEVRTAIVEAIETLESENDSAQQFRYAIRSSAVGEDSEETSAAGQNSTYLGIQGKDNIIKSVAMCWASLFSYQSVKYRKQHGMSIKASMGVCVQKMVNADTAGVMFTRHPTTGDPSNIVITANYGLGESVVSAAVEPDTITIHKRWDNELSIKSSMLGNKKEKIVAKDSGVVTIDLKDDENAKVCLSEEIALRLAAIGVTLETLFGSARDIEWAVANENIYLLQARPITTLYTWTDYELSHELDSGVPSDIDMTTFANVGEVLPKPMSPLALSVILRSLNKGVADAFKIPNRLCFNAVGMKCCINYYNTFLRDPSKTITLLNKVIDIAVCGNVVISPEIHKIACERNGLATPQQRMFIMFKMVQDVIRNSAVIKTANEVSQNLTFDAEDFHTARSLYDEINKQLKAYIKVSECHMHTSRVSVTYQIFAMALLTKGYNDLITEHFSDISLLLGSCSDVVSAEVVKGLKKTVTYIKIRGKEEEFKKIDPSKAVDWLKINCPLAAAEFDNLLKNHGHRCIQEMDFLSEPWCLRPENLITVLQTTMDAPEKDESKKTLDADQTVSLLKTPKSALTKWLLKKLIPRCRMAVVNREMTKAILVGITHTFRLAYRRLGKLMVLEGYLPNEDLIFYLTNDEVEQILSRPNTTLTQKVLRRKRIFPRLSEVEYAEINVGVIIPVETKLDAKVDDKSVKIQGISVCGGSILNRACVITDLADAREIKPGDILITHSTDIAWSPYFPLLGGIVTELGGLISHGAVVAREYGLPCIIGAKRATQIFQTGDTVLLAASTGIVQLVQKCS